MLKKIITWAIVLFVIFYVATEPTGAADVVHSIYNGLHVGRQLNGQIRKLALTPMRLPTRAAPPARPRSTDTSCRMSSRSSRFVGIRPS